MKRNIASKHERYIWAYIIWSIYMHLYGPSTLAKATRWFQLQFALETKKGYNQQTQHSERKYDADITMLKLANLPNKTRQPMTNQTYINSP